MEDKIVQMAASKLLQAIYDADFLDESEGYRPKRGTPQGTIISLVLTNIHLHYALDLGVGKVVPKGLQGDCETP